MIKALLVDDDRGNSMVLSEIIKTYCPNVKICGSAVNIEEAGQLITEEEPQLIFLDIEMPGGSGFDLLDRLKNIKTEVIFITAYDNFMIRAIRYSALDYILKPVNIQELVSAVERAENRLNSTAINEQLELLLSNIRQPAQVQRIAVPHHEGYIFISISDIERLEAKAAYTDIFMNDGKTYLVSKNIKEYESILPQNIFCRVHHAHLVNLNYVRTYHKGRGGYIEMISGTSIEVAVRKKDEFLNRFR